MLRAAALLVLVLLPLGFAPACGGGGGSAPAPACTKPGTLRALGVQGQAAPGTVGNFGAFPLGVLLDTAANGWAVFNGVTTDGTKPEGVWVAMPDATVLLAFWKGETVPDAGGGTISGFQAVRVNAQGHVLVLVSITGDANGRDFGLLTAQVIGGVVVGTNDLVYETTDLTASGSSGTLTAIDATKLFLVDDGRTFFVGGTSGGLTGLWSVNVDGTNLKKEVQETDLNPIALPFLDLKQVGVSRSGNRFAFVADTGGPNEDGLYIGTTGTGAYLGIAQDGNGLNDAPRFGSIVEIWAGGPLLVYDSGTVVWKAQGSAGLPDDVVLVGNNTVPFSILARSGDPAPSAGVATFASLDLLQHRAETAGPMVRAQFSGAINGVDFALYGLQVQPPALALYETRPAPSDYGTSAFTDTFPGLNAQGYVDVARNGALAFAGLLQNGVSGMFWLIPGCGFFTICISGGPALSGDTFGAFAPNANHTCHDDVVLFRAPLTVAGTGVFRQGP